ncbi:MAG: hypothetical protein ACYS26_13430 [Planctomycetota bacterium]|jgi:hypothetical protein
MITIVMCGTMFVLGGAFMWLVIWGAGLSEFLRGYRVGFRAGIERNRFEFCSGDALELSQVLNTEPKGAR